MYQDIIFAQILKALNYKSYGEYRSCNTGYRTGR